MLHQALREKDLKGVVKWIEDGGADINVILKGIGALHLSAAMDPPFGVVFTQLLLEHGADPNVASSGGLTPVHVAVLWGREDTLKLVIAAGGVPGIKDTQGRTAYDILLEENRINCEALLRILRREGDRKAIKSGVEVGDDTTENVVNRTSMLHLGEIGLSTYREKDIKVQGEKDLPDSYGWPGASTPDDACSHDSHMASYLHESPVSHHLDDDQSSISFHNTPQKSWFSYFSCAPKLSKIRRRRLEDGASSLSFPQSFTNWLRNLFGR